MALIEEEKSITLSHRGHFGNVMARLYADLDTVPPPQALQGYPADMRPFVTSIYDAHQIAVFNYANPVQFPTYTTERPVDDDKIVVGFSGGKDSLAAALLAQKKGWKPVLFYVKGINRGYPNEEDCVVACAERTGLPLVIEGVSGLPKGSGYKENPVKDQMIIAMMIDWGMAHGVGKFSMGLETCNKAMNMNIFYNWSDSVEMIGLWNAWVVAHWPDYRWEYLVENDFSTLGVIADHDMTLLESTISCLTPYRFQRMRREQQMKKFGVPMLPNRCGMCWKCCVEYMRLCTLRKIKKPDVRFARFCFDKYKKDIDTVYRAGYGKGLNDRQILDTIVYPHVADNTPFAEMIGI